MIVPHYFGSGLLSGKCYACGLPRSDEVHPRDEPLAEVAQFFEPPFSSAGDQITEGTDPMERIFQAIGTASMCWEHVDLAGVFNEQQASNVASALIDDLLAMGVVFPSETPLDLDMRIAHEVKRQLVAFEARLPGIVRRNMV
jgi:hypothetical protein